MAINKTLAELFGAGATQTITDFTIPKAALVSNRVPPAFQPLLPLAENTAESLITSLVMKVWETQDTSPDSEFAIFGPEVQLVSLISDGVPTVYDQFVLSIRILNKRPTAKTMPDPNSL